MLYTVRLILNVVADGTMTYFLSRHAATFASQPWKPNLLETPLTSVIGPKRLEVTHAVEKIDFQVGILFSMTQK